MKPKPKSGNDGLGTGAERRRTPRAEARLAAEFRILNRAKLALGVTSREDPCPAQVRNVSPEGALLWVGEPLNPPAVISMMVTLPHAEEPVRGLAEVKHQRPVTAGQVYAVGLEFLSMSASDRALVSKFVSFFAPGQSRGPKN